MIDPESLPKDADLPWPWGPAEEYLDQYEQYLIGMIDDEPTVPTGLDQRDLKFIQGYSRHLEFRYENGLREESLRSPAMHETLLEIQGLPEVGQKNSSE
ncbi:hypothetical protein HYS84_02845 [Candidatus Saccharibacteria bacterium]|nr:hypothetical protein [Candidatus Saccharibacteria bacterium]